LLLGIHAALYSIWNTCLVVILFRTIFPFVFRWQCLAFRWTRYRIIL